MKLLENPTADGRWDFFVTINRVVVVTCAVPCVVPYECKYLLFIHNAEEAKEGSALDTEISPAANELFEALGATISPDLFIEALTHRSFAHEHPGTANYERLEFLGDAVLELVTTETLYTLHPTYTEGQMAKIRAKTVSEESLSAIARNKLHVGPFILLGHGESAGGGADKDSILCDIVEALIGAVFIEQGIDVARHAVHKLIDSTLEKTTHEGPALDWKTSLTVKAHELGRGEVAYHMEVGGPEYQQIFTARVTLGDDDTVIAEGTGTSKRKAQLDAAEKAWKSLN